MSTPSPSMSSARSASARLSASTKIVLLLAVRTPYWDLAGQSCVLNKGDDPAGRLAGDASATLTGRRPLHHQLPKCMAPKPYSTRHRVPALRPEVPTFAHGCGRQPAAPNGARLHGGSHAHRSGDCMIVSVFMHSRIPVSRHTDTLGAKFGPHPRSRCAPSRSYAHDRRLATRQ
jgi:hypothetical protein